MCIRDRKYIDESLMLISSKRGLYKEEKGADIFFGLAKGFKFINEDEKAAAVSYTHLLGVPLFLLKFDNL